MSAAGTAPALVPPSCGSHGETARQATRTLCNLSLSPELRETLVQVRRRVCLLLLTSSG